MCGGGGGGSGSIDPTIKAQFVNVPSMEDFRGFIDEIFGTKTEMVKDPATGRKVPVVRRSQRTPERQFMFENGSRLIQSSLKGLEKMSQAYPQAMAHFVPLMNVFGDLNRERRQDMAEIVNVPNFDAYVKNFTQMQMNAVQQQYEQGESALKEKFSHMGYGQDSTAFGAALANLERGKRDAMIEIEGKTPAYASSLYKDYVEGHRGHLGLKEGVRTGISSDTAKMLGLEKEMFTDQMGLQENLFSKGMGMTKYDDTLADKGSARVMDAAFKGHAIDMDSKKAENTFNLTKEQLEIDKEYKQRMAAAAEAQAEGPGFGEILLGGVSGLAGAFGGGFAKTGGTMLAKSVFG